MHFSRKKNISLVLSLTLSDLKYIFQMRGLSQSSLDNDTKAFLSLSQLLCITQN